MLDFRLLGSCGSPGDFGLSQGFVRGGTEKICKFTSKTRLVNMFKPMLRKQSCSTEVAPSNQTLMSNFIFLVCLSSGLYAGVNIKAKWSGLSGSVHLKTFKIMCYHLRGNSQKLVTSYNHC